MCSDSLERYNTNMKKFWMVWVSFITVVVLVVGGLLLQHKQNVSKYCSKVALDYTNSNVPLYFRYGGTSDSLDRGSEYATQYMSCVRSR